jgi:hypothetical protein
MGPAMSRQEVDVRLQPRCLYGGDGGASCRVATAEKRVVRSLCYLATSSFKKKHSIKVRVILFSAIKKF